MKWLSYFSKSKIPYYIYKIKKNDLMIINNNLQINQSIIILYGTIFLCKNFNNKKNFPVAIVSTNNIIYLKSFKNNTQYYYKLIALDNSYVLSFSFNYLIKNTKTNKQLFSQIIHAYENTLIRYEMINHILVHKYIKSRIIQLILILCLEFGIINNKKIIIPFSLSQKNLANIIKSNKITVNKIISYLIKQNIIKYSSQKRIYLQNISLLSYTFLIQYK